MAKSSKAGRHCRAAWCQYGHGLKSTFRTKGVSEAMREKSNNWQMNLDTSSHLP